MINLTSFLLYALNYWHHISIITEKIMNSVCSIKMLPSEPNSLLIYINNHSSDTLPECKRLSMRYWRYDKHGTIWQVDAHRSPTSVCKPNKGKTCPLRQDCHSVSFLHILFIYFYPNTCFVKKPRVSKTNFSCVLL